MATAEFEGERLTEEEILSTSFTLLLGGHETTTRLLGNSLYDLIRHPEQLAYSREEPDAMKAAVEELLRFSGPFRTLLDRFKEIRLAVEPEWEYGFLRGPVSLHLDLST